MKRFIRGATIVVAIWVVLVVINVICNINGYELDAVLTGTAAPVGAMLIEHGLTMIAAIEVQTVLVLSHKIHKNPITVLPTVL